MYLQFISTVTSVNLTEDFHLHINRNKQIWIQLNVQHLSVSSTLNIFCKLFLCSTFVLYYIILLPLCNCLISDLHRFENFKSPFVIRIVKWILHTYKVGPLSEDKWIATVKLETSRLIICIYWIYIILVHYFPIYWG